MTLPGLRNMAMNLLSRREYSRKELGSRLLRQFSAVQQIEVALDRLEEEGLLSDQRFAESFVHQRISRGFGPVRIAHELRDRGVDELIFKPLLANEVVDWDERLQNQREKRFGADFPVEYKEKMKQARFLQNKGFSPESVMRLFR